MAERTLANETLPPGWVWTTLGTVADVVGGGTPSREVPEYFEGSITWLTPTEIPKDRIAIISTSKECITQEAVVRSSARLVPTGSVLMTSRASIGYVAITGTELATNQGFANFICTGAVQNLYLAYWLWSQAEFYRQNATGTTFKEITKSKLRPFSLPLPPLNEQRRIVAKIEELLTRLDAGVASLKKAQANLKRYKASVLKAACEGRLVPTEAELAHAEGRSYEPASVLLQRILAEREGRGDARRRPPPQPPDTRGLPELPEGWCWASVEQLNPTDRPCAYGVLQPGDDAYDGIPLIRVGDIEDGHVHITQLKRIKHDIANQYQRTFLQGGEVLITLVGAIGRTAVAPLSIAGANTARAVGVIPLVPTVNPYWIEIWFRNPSKIIEMVGKAHEVARKTLNLEDVRSATVALPPLAEQRRIVAEVERRLSVVAEIEAAIDANLARAERLRQAILKRAFSGKLVPQDPNDEPASLLLERIRAQREPQPALLGEASKSRRRP